VTRVSPRIVVVGSLNIDYIASVERLPRPGETVAAAGLRQSFGGKGANQAVAAARQGASVAMIGCVGVDDGGRRYCNRLHAERIDTAAISMTSTALTGTALIAVDSLAENMIVVAAGANGELKPPAVRTHRALIARARIVLLQLEIPLVTVVETVRLANRLNIPVVLNPSPLRKAFPWGKCRLATLIANTGETEAIFGLAADRLPARVSAWRRALKKRGINQLVITRGSKPTLCLDATVFLEIPTLPVKPVDSVGAGDAFAGTFAARRAEGADLATAVRFANCAGALATLQSGAQEAIPTRAATDRADRRLSRVAG
jgi:ribokinase